MLEMSINSCAIFSPLWVQENWTDIPVWHGGEHVEQVCQICTKLDIFKHQIIVIAIGIGDPKYK